MAIPLSPDEQARVDAYWGGQGLTSSAGPAMSAAPPDPAASYYGAPPEQPPPQQVQLDPAAPSASPVGPPEPLMSVAPTPQPTTSEPNMSVTPKDYYPPSWAPTAADNAAFQNYTAKLTQPKPASSGAASGAKAANPDPYGLEAARKAELASFDTRKGAVDRAATAQQDATVMQAEHLKNLGRQQEEDAAIGRAENEIAQRHFDDGMSEINRQLDDVKSRKVDPYRLMKESPALGAFSVIGGIVGGFYQGLNGKDKNPFLEDLNRQIDRGIAEDERQIRDERSAVGEKASLLQQLRLSQKDKATADLQYRNLAYEAAKGQINAEAQAAGTGVARANADDAIAQLSAAQAQLQEQIAAKKQAAAVAAAQHATAHAKEVHETYKSIYEKVLSAGHTPAQAEAEARRAVGVIYMGNVGQRSADMTYSGQDAALTREQRGKMAMDKHDAQRVSDAFNKEIDEMKRHPALNNLGLGTAAAAKLGQRIAPESAATEQDLNEINTSIINAIGKTAKDAEGKPNVAMMQMYEHRFSINPTDTKEIALRKLDGAREVVNRLAAQQGADTPEGKTSVEAKLGAKPVR